jgi:serine protease Do
MLNFKIFQEKRFAFVAITLLFGIIIGFFLAARLNVEGRLESATVDSPQNAAGTGQMWQFEDAVSSVAEKIGSAVVSISSESIEKPQQQARRVYPFGESPFEEDPFRKFFDDFLGQIPEREFKRMGLGSGVIIDANGFILTNEHVVRDADKLTVKLSDGREFKAKVKGSDPRSDLAVIQIDAKNLPTASLGDSDIVKIGQWVVAIGNPFGFALQNPEPTVTVGVVSALHRSLGRSFGRERDYSDLIQTDAAINPGNSGGPLVNLRGEIIGINVAIFSTTGGYEGIGFAIPVNSAKRIVSKLIKGEEIEYGWLGITIQDIDPKLANYMKLSSAEGVLVVNVLKGGPAERAGIKNSDVIVEFDSRKIRDTKDLLKVVGQASVGGKASVVVMRDKKTQALEVTIGRRPAEEELVSAPGTGEKEAAKSWRGLVVKDLNEAIARRFNVEERQGVVVVDIEPNSAADEAGIVVGDVIVELNEAKISNKDDFDRISAKVAGDCLVKTGRGYLVISAK